MMCIYFVDLRILCFPEIASSLVVHNADLLFMLIWGSYFAFNGSFCFSWLLRACL